MTFRRRHVLTGAAATLAAAPLARTGSARADESIVVGTWGGDYGNLLQQFVDKPLMAPQGITVSQDIANNDPRRTKLLAERGSRRGSMDVACINNIDTFLLDRAGVLEKVQESAVPRLSAVLPVFRKPDTVPHIYSALAVVYNPDKIKAPPKSFADLLDPKYNGRASLVDIQYVYNILGVNLGVGGSMNDLQPGMKALMDWKATNPRIYPSNEALAAGFQAEETWISLMWVARGFMWKSGGIPVAWSIPDAGSIPVLFEAGVPRNARNKDAAFKYLDAMLDPAAQAGFAQKMGYVPHRERRQAARRPGPADRPDREAAIVPARPRLRVHAGAPGGHRRLLGEAVQGVGAWRPSSFPPCWWCWRCWSGRSCCSGASRSTCTARRS